MVRAGIFTGKKRIGYLHEADAHLDMLRLYLRHFQRWKWINDGQYRHVSVMVAEIGRLLGGWKEQSGA